MALNGQETHEATHWATIEKWCKSALFSTSLVAIQCLGADWSSLGSLAVSAWDKHRAVDEEQADESPESPESASNCLCFFPYRSSYHFFCILCLQFSISLSLPKVSVIFLECSFLIKSLPDFFSYFQSVSLCDEVARSPHHGQWPLIQLCCQAKASWEVRASPLREAFKLWKLYLKHIKSISYKYKDL